MYSMNIPLLIGMTGALLSLFFPMSTFATTANPSPSQVVVQGNTEFALDLYAQLKGGKGNLIFSPYSISTAMAMIYAGGRGNTESQIAETMHFTLPQKALHTAFSELQDDLNRVQKPGSIQVLIANAIWPHKAYPFKKVFLGLLETHYRASITAVDYIDHLEEARQSINRWVENQTMDKIKELIKPGILNTLTRMVLTNAIYFKGNWGSQFNKESTKPMPFQVTPTQSLMIPMMYQRQEFGYHADEKIQVLEMGYEGNRLSMLVLLPVQKDGIAGLEENLNALQLQQWTGQIQKQKVETWFPKFKITSSLGLNEPLMALGTIDAFGNKADFSGMDGTRELFLSTVLHKAFVEVNEKGTEAAAATGGVISVTSAPILPQFRADHPFLFFIRDNASKSILFVGRVVQPKA
jgi:serine protease inhibitor